MHIFMKEVLTSSTVLVYNENNGVLYILDFWRENGKNRCSDAMSADYCPRAVQRNCKHSNRNADGEDLYGFQAV